jgi:hypothetical protein
MVELSRTSIVRSFHSDPLKLVPCQNHLQKPSSQNFEENK